jgi:phage gp46-like protein
MADIKLLYDAVTGEFDVGISNGDLVSEEGLETAVIISLFTDRWAEGDINTEQKRDRRGWWADETLPENDHLGSLLWTYGRQKITSLDAIEDTAREALQWMVDDGVASAVSVSAARVGVDGVELRISISQPDDVIHKYKFLWGQ